jgi:hypothetical protein
VPTYMLASFYDSGHCVGWISPSRLPVSPAVSAGANYWLNRAHALPCASRTYNSPSYSYRSCSFRICKKLP